MQQVQWVFRPLLSVGFTSITDHLIRGQELDAFQSSNTEGTFPLAIMPVK